MNFSEQKILIFLAIALVILMIGLFVLALFAVYLLYKKTKNNHHPIVLPPKNRERVKIHPVIDATSSTGLCLNHKERNSVGICSICEQEFCAQCLKEMDKVYLCPEHFKLYTQNKWIPITNEKTTPDTPQNGVYIYNYKKNIWDKDKIPSYILNEYKINMEGDFVETYVQLHVIEDDAPKLKSELVLLKDIKSE
ncbi:hypothetical protein M899_0082 [Bacteriovorax sp. BSW11_IV]|uniref:hypothetical protein n=1 Tax=Bacteriovorax sp. BSW11_IV TaxID=1353529 RepID=UPI00038A55F9|nr:hypothetical protein [Bacteriovorax sp. BSW11_IV]EQC42910.1 hypothetical protein M899_0082 [Bacteriovorax sp. BSW11_IV]